MFVNCSPIVTIALGDYFIKGDIFSAWAEIKTKVADVFCVYCPSSTISKCHIIRISKLLGHKGESEAASNEAGQSVLIGGVA